MIFDCFTFFNEKELLEIRIAELSGLDVCHIAVQANKTFTNKPKPFIDLDYPEVVALNITDMPGGDDPWQREKWQRNSIMPGLEAAGAQNDDLVIIADADEIPSAKAIKEYNPSMGVTAFVMDKFGYWLNCREGKQSWEIAKIMTYEKLKQSTPDQIRNSGPANKIQNGGWHFSFMGGIDKVVEKFNSFSHQELNNDRWANRERLRKYIELGHSLWSDEPDDLWPFIQIDDTFPKYVIENQHGSLKHLIKSK